MRAEFQEYNTAFAPVMDRFALSPTYSTERNKRRIDSSDVVQGHIFWLASKKELPKHAVKRAHGKGAVEEGIYNHPVVVTSRTAEEGHLVHFHLVSRA